MATGGDANRSAIRLGSVALVALGSVALLSSCGTEVAGTQHQAEPTLGQVRQISDPHSITLPFQRVEYTADELVLVDAGLKVLRARCTDRFGVTSTDRSAPDLSAAANWLDRHYGVSDATVAETYGYHIPTQPPGNDKDRPDVWDPSPQERAVVLGTEPDGSPLRVRPTDAAGEPLPEGGCAEEAAAKLGGGKYIDNDAIGAWTNTAWQLSESDSRTVAAVRAWATCMRRHGYEFTSVWEANEEFRDRALSPEEIAQATTDVGCRESTNLVGVWNAVETAYQNDIIEANAAAFDRMLQVKADQLAAARALTKDVARA